MCTSTTACSSTITTITTTTTTPASILEPPETSIMRISRGLGRNQSEQAWQMGAVKGELIPGFALPNREALTPVSPTPPFQLSTTTTTTTTTTATTTTTTC